MARPSVLSIDRVGFGYDFVINGVSLLDRLVRHEGLDLNHGEYACALGVVDGAKSRLLLEKPPDLLPNCVALYVCGMCGGYDGNTIGTHVYRDEETVTWVGIGYYSDVDYCVRSSMEFRKVRSFRFDWPAYSAALSAIVAP